MFSNRPLLLAAALVCASAAESSAAPRAKADPKATAAPAARDVAAAGPLESAPEVIVAAAVEAPAGGAAVASPEVIEGKPSSVQIQIRLLADKLAAAFKGREGEGRYAQWAVVPFGSLGEEAEKRRLGEVVAAEIEGRLKVDHRFVLVERMQLARVLQEIELAQVGLLDESKAPEVGKMANAEVLVTGTVGVLGDKFVVNARVVAVEEAKILASAQVTIDAPGLVALSSDAVVLRTKSDAVFRSLLVPGWGQFYNREEAKGTALMFASATLLAGGITFYALGSKAESEYRTISKEAPGPCAGRPLEQLGGCVEAQRVLAESRFGISRALFLGLGVVYAYNLFDAWFFGYSPDASTASLYAEGLSFDVAPGYAGLSASF